ncbi:MAG: ABC transporter substrate-binding protein [Pseudomonadota bacterium]
MRLTRRNAVAGLAVGLGASLAPGHRLFAQSPRTLDIQLLGFALAIHVPAMAAIQEGLPAMPGYVAPKTTRLNQIRLVTQAMIGGGADIGETDPPTVMSAVEAGADLKIIGHVYNNTSLVIVVNADRVKDLADLVKPDIRVSIGARGDVTHVLTVGPLQKRGLDIDKLLLVELPGSGTRIQAILSKRVDAVLVHFDQAEELARQGNFKVILEPHRDYRVWVNEVWVATGAWLKRPGNERVAVDFLKAQLAAFRRANIDFAWFAQNYRKHATLPKANEAKDEVLRPIWRTLVEETRAWPANMDMNLDNFRAQIPVYKAAGAIQGTVKIEDIVETRYVEQAIRELG